LNFFFITTLENGRPTIQLSSMCLKTVTFYDAFCMNEHPLYVSGRKKNEVFKTPASSSNSFKLRTRMLLLTFILVTWLLNRLPRNTRLIHSTGKFLFPTTNTGIKNMWIYESSDKHKFMAVYLSTNCPNNTRYIMILKVVMRSKYIQTYHIF
jgi:hypothetical protein